MNRAIVCFLSASFSLVLAVGASAQFSDSQSNDGQSFSGIEGYWAGYVHCDRRGWAVFHHIQDSSGRMTSDYRYFGGNAGSATVDIFSAGQSFLFDAQESNVYDYQYDLVDGELIGVGRGEDCSSRLRRVTKTDYDALD